MLRVHSIETLGTLDGPGIRTVVFLQGCPLRCGYCHNPDTWSLTGGKMMCADELYQKIMRMKPYFKNGGGVTFSGGDPLMQAAALRPLVRRLKEAHVHIALDTSGAYWSEEVGLLLDDIDLVLLDIKHTEHETFEVLTHGNLDRTLTFLEELKSRGVHYWARQVIVPSFNDDIAQVKKFKQMASSTLCDKIELLPFHKMGMHKWDALGLVSPFAKTPEMKESDIEGLYKAIAYPVPNLEN